MENTICIILPLVKGFYNMLKKVKCAGISGVCAPHHSGKSHFINSVVSKKYALLDLEENVRLLMSAEEKAILNNMSESSSKELHYFPLCKKYLEQIKKDHRGKKLIVFSSNYDLLVYCGIVDILTYVPNNSLS